MLRTIRRCTAMAVLALAAASASAQELAPDALLKSVTNEVTGLLKQSRGHLNAAKTSQLNELVERKILPLFDFARMTQSAMGRNWALATPEQRDALTAEFTSLLVRTYSTALRNYRDERIEFKTTEVPAGATRTTVKTLVGEGATRVSVDYDMAKTAAGWKIVEMRMDGVNVSANYRDTFASRVRESGIDGLIKSLAEKNGSYAGVGSSRTLPREGAVEFSSSAFRP